MARQDLRTGQPILADLILKPGDRGFLAAVLQPGLRAISVTVEYGRPKRRLISAAECPSASNPATAPV